MTAELCDLTAHDLSAKLAAGDVRAIDVLESTLRRIDQVDERLHTFLTRTEDQARTLSLIHI